MKEKRRHPRFKTSPQFKIKAKIKPMGGSRVFYLAVDTLSMGGLSLHGDVDLVHALIPGHTYEVTLFRGHQSLKMSMKMVGPVRVSETTEKLGAQIIGIDEASRHMLATFIEEMQKSQPAKLDPEIEAMAKVSG